MFLAFILWFGWYGFNTGSAISITGPNQAQVVSLVAINTTLAAASACISSLLVNYHIEDKKMGEGSFSLTSAMNGCLGGLVSITGGCGVVEPWAAVVIGFIAGLLYLYSSKVLVRARIDDAVDAVPVHMTNGVWGTFAVGLFASSDRLKLAYGEVGDKGLFIGGNGTLLGCQCVGILFVLGWVTAIMFPFFCILNYLGWYRSEPADEVEGLDSRYHKSVKSRDRVFVEEDDNPQHEGNPDDENPHFGLSHYGEGNRRLRYNIEEHKRKSSVMTRSSTFDDLPNNRLNT